MSIEENITPSEVRNRLREYLDHNLAQRLQDEEFNRHYAMNRTERSTVGGDVKISKAQQRLEDELAIQQRRLANQTITDSDEALARQIYAKYAEDEERARNHLNLQLRQDEELAMRISKNETKTPPSTPSEATLIDLDSNGQPLFQPVANRDMNPFSTAMPSTSTQSTLLEHGIPLPGLTENVTRSRSTTVDSLDDPLPTPPSFIFEHTNQPPSEQSAPEQTLVAQDVGWSANVPLLPSNPFYQDVVQAMNALPLNSFSNHETNPVTQTRNVQSHRPLTPNNSLADPSLYTLHNNNQATASSSLPQQLTELEQNQYVPYIPNLGTHHQQQ
ncbi:unnamed protein product [Auanema sp. JU1783]|nr:unnamed protein product [Auanema sp. JU1783]